MNVGVRGWIDSDDKMPHDHEVVIVLYAGRWPGRGVSGVADLYAHDGVWFNVPEGVTVCGWIPMPNYENIK